MKYRATQTNSEELSSVETPLGVGVLRGFPSTSLVTSNDLLFTLHGAYSPRPLNYEIVAQSADEVRNVRNAPALSMGTYLEESRGSTELSSSLFVCGTRYFNGHPSFHSLSKPVISPPAVGATQWIEREHFKERIERMQLGCLELN